MKNSKWISIRMDDESFNIINDKARNLHMGISTLVREYCLNIITGKNNDKEYLETISILTDISKNLSRIIEAVYDNTHLFEKNEKLSIYNDCKNAITKINHILKQLYDRQNL